jgi:hypothetical protein
VLFGHDAAKRALINSFTLSTIAAIVIVLIAVPLAYFLVWRRSRPLALIGLLIEMPYALVIFSTLVVDQSVAPSIRFIGTSGDEPSFAVELDEASVQVLGEPPSQRRLARAAQAEQDNRRAPRHGSGE